MDRYNYTTAWNLLVDTRWNYDGAGQIKELKHFKADRSTLLAGYTYGWDAAGRMTSMEFSSAVRNNDAEDVSTFSHDSTGQLTGADRGGIDTTYDESYVYDENGNRDTVSRYGATNQDWVVGANNRLTADGTFTYTYDDEGNQLTKTRKSTAVVDDHKQAFTWDHRNRLTKVTFKRNDGTVTKVVDYYYDMFNRWTQRDLDSDGDTGTAAKLVEQFMHDGQEMVLHGVPNSGSWRSFMRGPGQDNVLFESRDALRVFLGDHLNTIRDVVDTSGNIVNHLTVDSFGRRISESDGTIEVMIGLSGRPYDEVSGLQNHLNRWYSVDTGRWLSEDPVGFAGGDVNLNRFVGNGPLVHRDPEGLSRLGIELKELYLKRAGLGVLIIPQIFTGIAEWGLNYHYSFQDDGSIRNAHNSDWARSAFMIEAALRSGKARLDGKWRQIDVSVQDIYGLIPRSKYEITIRNERGVPFYNTASFWLGGLHQFLGAGSYEVSLCRDKNDRIVAQFRNINMTWGWVDEVDAKSIVEYPWLTDDFIDGYAETWADVVFDKGLNANYWAVVGFVQRGTAGPYYYDAGSRQIRNALRAQ